MNSAYQVLKGGQHGAQEEQKGVLVGVGSGLQRAWWACVAGGGVKWWQRIIHHDAGITQILSKNVFQIGKGSSKSYPR